MLNPLQAAKAVIGFARVVRDPDRLNDVFQFIDGISSARPKDFEPILAAFRATAEGRRALRDRPRVGRIDLTVLRALPDGTLGREYARLMDQNKLDPGALPQRPAADDVAFVQAHLYETHDLWHVATGFPTDRPGELGLQAFYLAQFPSHVAVGILCIGLLNTLLFEFADHGPRFDAITRGWLLGRRARSFLGVDWRALWATPLADVRAQLEVDIAGVERAVQPYLRAASAPAASIAAAA